MIMPSTVSTHNIHVSDCKGSIFNLTSLGNSSGHLSISQSSFTNTGLLVTHPFTSNIQSFTINITNSIFKNISGMDLSSVEDINIENFCGQHPTNRCGDRRYSYPKRWKRQYSQLNVQTISTSGRTLTALHQKYAHCFCDVVPIQ